MGIAAGVFLVLAGVFVAWMPLIGAAIGLMGLTVIGLPLATPETIGWLGYRPARRLARALGVLLVLVGIWICLWMGAGPAPCGSGAFGIQSDVLTATVAFAEKNGK